MSVYRVKAGTAASVIAKGKASKNDITLSRDLYFEEAELAGGRFKPGGTCEFRRAGATLLILGRNVERLKRKPKSPFVALYPSRVDQA